MKKVYLFCIMISCIAFAQQKTLKVNDLKPKTQDFKFPVVSFASKPLVQNKINTFLQVNELDFVPESGGNASKFVSSGKNLSSIFVYFYNWKKIETPKNILSISLKGEISGGTPYDFLVWKNFDLKTGNLINLQDIFEPEKIDSVQNIVNGKVILKLQNFVDDLKSKNELSDSEKEQTRMYTECLESSNLNNLEHEKFYFTKDKLVIVRERCANQALKNIDNLGSFKIDFTFKELQPFLNSFGKNLISKSDKKISTKTIENKIFKGKINKKQTITLLIKNINEDNTFSAVYWFDNKKLVDCNGELTNNKVTISEKESWEKNGSHEEPKIIIEAEIVGKKLLGTWQNVNSEKKEALELEEF